MRNLVPYFLTISLVIASCDKEGRTEPIPSTPQLLFSSGFEEGTYMDDIKDNYQVLRGTDNQTGFTWPIKILGSNFSGIHRINDDGGLAIDNYLENVPGANGTQSTALFQRVNYDVGVTQTPYQINSLKENPKELYISYWMKIDDISLNGPDNWRAIWEYKTKKYNISETEGFRMIAFIATDSNGNPYWLLQGDKNSLTPVWQVRNTSTPIPREEWFKVEYYLKWSKNSDGYASMHVNGNLIAEHYGATTTNGDDMDFIILTQVYGNTHPMYQWVDDIEIWSGLPE